MIKIFTQTDLIRYLYQETTEEEKKEIDSALQKDSELKALFSELKAALQDLNNATLEPSKRTIVNILNYSRTSGLKH